MNEINPVTESEMQDWFRRLSTMIVSASNQSAEIKRLQEDFAVANSRLGELAGDNSKLKAEVADTWRLMQDVEKERDAAKADAASVRERCENLESGHHHIVQEYEGHLQQAHDAMAARDQRIAALEAQVKEAQARELERETVRVQTERTLEGAQSNVRYWTGRAEQAERERDNCHSALAEQSRTISNLSDKLRAVQAKVQEFRSLFEAPQESDPTVIFNR